MYNKYRDPKKYYDFHGDHENLTEECTHLKDNIEDLIRIVYLTQFKAKISYCRTYKIEIMKVEVTTGGQTRTKPATDQKREAGVRSRDILVITGGPVHAGKTVRGEKASVNEFRHQVNYHNAGRWPAPPVIPHCTFTKDDCKGIIYLHDDPMVLSLSVSNRRMHRILIDGASTANILFWPTFQELRIDEKYVKPITYPMIAFTGASIIPDGIVSLPV